MVGLLSTHHARPNTKFLTMPTAPGGGDDLRADQDGLAGALGPAGEIQPAHPHRAGPGPTGPLRRPSRLQNTQTKHRGLRAASLRDNIALGPGPGSALASPI